MRAFNAEAVGRRAINSTLEQTWPQFEISVVDDGSSDNAAVVAASTYEAVRVYWQPNGGPGSARNHGIRVSHGEWLALLDTDDRWMPNKLESQVELAADPSVGVIGSLAGGRTSRPIPPEPITFD